MPVSTTTIKAANDAVVLAEKENGNEVNGKSRKRVGGKNNKRETPPIKKAKTVMQEVAQEYPESEDDIILM